MRPSRRKPLKVRGPSDGPRFAIVILTAIYAVNFLDRQVVAILAAPIKAEFALSNLQLGLISGIAFAAFYSVLGIPIARIADRGDRVGLIGFACLLWSAMTAVCGVAANFTQLFVARMLVGVGEAACVPASHSLISAWTRPDERPRALSIFALGIPVGTLLGLVIGGIVAESSGWRAAFFLAAVPGAVLALLALAVLRDPSRPGKIIRRRDKAGGPALLPLLRIRTLRQLCIGAAAASMSGYGLVAFLGVYLTERFSLSISQIGLGLGLAIGIGGGIGAYCGGMLATRAWLRGKSGTGSGAAGLVAAGAAIAAFLAAPTAPLAFLGLTAVSAFNALWYGSVFAAVQDVAPEQSRASAAALLNLIVNLVGLGLGPPLIGAAADAAAGERGFHYAFAAAAAINVVGAYFLWRVRTPTRPVIAAT